MRWDGLPLVVFGSGGVSKETVYIIEEINNFSNSKIYNFLGFIENDDQKVGEVVIKDYKVISSDNKFSDFSKKFSVLGVVIPIGNPKIKISIYEKIKNESNLVYPNIFHPSVTFDKTTVNFGFGNIIAPGSRLTTDIRIGNFNLININTLIGHDVTIGNFNVINSLVSVSGNVKIGDGCLVGTGADILQQKVVCDNSVVGSGSVVTKNVRENETVFGMPAVSIYKKTN